MFIHFKKNSFIFFHVDDLIVGGQTDVFEELLLKHFPNLTSHNPETLLGMNLKIANNSIELSQPSLIAKGLDLIELSNSWKFKTHLLPKVQLHTESEEDH